MCSFREGVRFVELLAPFCTIVSLHAVHLFIFGAGSDFCPTWNSHRAAMLGSETLFFAYTGLAATFAAASLFALAIALAWRGGREEGRQDREDRRPEVHSVASASSAYTDKEEAAILELRQRLQGSEEPPERLLAQLAWARELDIDAAAELWRRHVAMAKELNIRDVSDDLVRKAYDDGFCVRSGVDLDGRPMIWVRLAFSVPSTMTASQVVKNTWMAQDATLCSGIEANRRGICFVYDLKGVGLKNVSFDPLALRACIRGALSHPSHISRVWLLDAPRIFLLAWQAFKHFVPENVRELVHFADTGKGRRKISQVCRSSELPVYLGGPRRFSREYCDWMFEQLEGQPQAYRTSKLRLPVPSRRKSGRSGACHKGIGKLLRCACLA